MWAICHRELKESSFPLQPTEYAHFCTGIYWNGLFVHMPFNGRPKRPVSKRPVSKRPVPKRKRPFDQNASNFKRIQTAPSVSVRFAVLARFRFGRVKPWSNNGRIVSFLCWSGNSSGTSPHYSNRADICKQYIVGKHKWLIGSLYCCTDIALQHIIIGNTLENYIKHTTIVWAYCLILSILCKAGACQSLHS